MNLKNNFDENCLFIPDPGLKQKLMQENYLINSMKAFRIL